MQYASAPMPPRGGSAVSHISQAYPDRVEVRGRDLTRRPDGPAELHRVLPPAAHRPRADRRPALLPRPAARRDRRARDDAHQRRRADDARRRPRTRCRAPSRPGSSAAGRSSSARPRSARGCSRRRRRGSTAGDEPAAVAATIARRDPRRRRAAAGLRPPGAPAARPARRADPRARRRARRQRRRTSRSRARFRDAAAEAWGRPLTMNVSMPIAAVMLDLGFAAGRGQGGADPRPHRGPARPPRRGAASSPIGFLHGGGGRGGGRRTSRRRMMLDARGRDAAVGGAARARRRALPRAARLPARALAVLPREARAAGFADATRGGLGRDRAAAADREAASCARPCTPENPIGAHLCAAPRRDRPHLLDQRHDRHAELHPADRRRPRQLGHRLGAQLRGLGRRGRPAHRLHLQRRAVRRPAPRSRRSTASASATSRSAPATPSGCCARSSCCGPRPPC